MNVNLSRYELIDMVKSVPVSYRKCTKELDEAGEWEFDMNGPKDFHWYTKVLLSKTEDELYDFYKKLRNGDFYLPEDDKPAEYKPLKMPILRRTFPILTGLGERRR